jgi:hypothetical protein
VRSSHVPENIGHDFTSKRIVVVFVVFSVNKKYTVITQKSDDGSSELTADN